MRLTDEEKLLLVGGVIFLFWGPQIIGAFTRQAAKAAGGAVIDAATGTVIGAGEAVGIPATDPLQCQRDIAAGDTWNASFSCPTATFIRYLAGRVSGS